MEGNANARDNKEELQRMIEEANEKNRNNERNNNGDVENNNAKAYRCIVCQVSLL